jgi:hypothetical protein
LGPGLTPPTRAGHGLAGGGGAHGAGGLAFGGDAALARPDAWQRLNSAMPAPLLPAQVQTRARRRSGRVLIMRKISLLNSHQSFL